MYTILSLLIFSNKIYYFEDSKSIKYYCISFTWKNIINKTKTPKSLNTYRYKL